MREAFEPGDVSRGAAVQDRCARTIAAPAPLLLAFRAVIVACLRGLALDHVLNQNNAALAAAVTMLRDIFLHFAQHEK